MIDRRAMFRGLAALVPAAAAVPQLEAAVPEAKPANDAAQSPPPAVPPRRLLMLVNVDKIDLREFSENAAHYLGDLHATLIPVQGEEPALRIFDLSNLPALDQGAIEGLVSKVVERNKPSIEAANLADFPRALVSPVFAEACELAHRYGTADFRLRRTHDGQLQLELLRQYSTSNSYDLCNAEYPWPGCACAKCVDLRSREAWARWSMLQRQGNFPLPPGVVPRVADIEAALGAAQDGPKAT
jgi:hypothetical protein